MINSPSTCKERCPWCGTLPTRHTLPECHGKILLVLGCFDETCPMDIVSVDEKVYSDHEASAESKVPAAWSRLEAIWDGRPR